MATVYQRENVPELPRAGMPDEAAQLWFVGGVIAAIAAIAVYVENILSLQHAQNFLMGGLLGYVLYRASFGFTGPWKNFIARGKGLGTRKTLLMLAFASISMITYNAVFGTALVIHPVGWSLLIGAFMFGVGMQLGGCCGSGTAWVAGSGSARVAISLVFFIAGSVWGSVDAPFWWGMATFGRFSMIEHFGYFGAIAVTLAMLGGLAGFTIWREMRLNGALETYRAPDGPFVRKLLYGPWSPYMGAIIMGVLTGLVVIVTMQPWGITFGYTLYGVKILTALGFDVTTWTGALASFPFWGADWAKAAIAEPFWQNNAANMNIGIMLGAALAAGLVGKWRPTLKGVPMSSILAAALGGILMGYGARISTGCNIGAMVNGIASGSLHGWVWMGAAFVGTMLGTKLRPVFRIAN
jgi:uncharacterized membrane protein YedE/YeeE